MDTIFKAVSRRNLLKLFLALPVVKLMQSSLGCLFGLGANESVAATALKVAKVSELKEAWNSVRFTYRAKVQTKDVYGGNVLSEESIPGLVIRLPDDLARERGGGTKAKFEVVDLHCTHQRCETAYFVSRDDIRAVVNADAKNPVTYCPCHRSVYDLANGGKPIKGPAKKPLWKFNFEVKGDDIVVTGLDPKASVWEPGPMGGLTSEYPVRPGEPGL